MRIHETLGEDLWGFVRLWERICKLWERIHEICKDLERGFMGICKDL